MEKRDGEKTMTKQNGLRILLVFALTGLLGSAVNAQSSDGPTFQPGGSVDCFPNETLHWEPVPACGRYGESPMSIPGEMRCFNYFDNAAQRCERRCVWTGNCRAP